MERNSNLKPNEQLVANNANDWRSQHEPNLRNKVVSDLVRWLQRVFTALSINELKDFALEMEKEAYGIATDKDDYKLKISERILMIKREAMEFHSRSSVNKTNTLEPAQVLNQGQLVPASVPYTQASTSQHWLPPGFQSNPNVHASCLPQQLQQPQNTNYMFQHQVNQQRLNETIHIRNFRPPHMQQQTQQQFSHPTSFPSIQHPFSAVSGRQNPQISTLEACPSYQQKKAELNQLKQKMEELEKEINQDINQLDTQYNHSTSWQNNGEYQGGVRVSSSQQRDTAAASQALNQRQSLPTSQPWLPQEIQSNHNMFQHQMNQLHLNETIRHWNFRPPHMQQLAQPPQPIQQQFPHPTSFPSIQQKFPRFSAVSGQQNSPFFTRSQLSGLQGCARSQQKMDAHSQEQIQEALWPNSGEHQGAFTASIRGMAQQNMHQQSQPMMYQSQHPELPPTRKRNSQQHLEGFQAASSLGKTQNRVDQQNQSYPRVTPENPSTYHGSAGKTVNASGGKWQEETYQKIQALKEKHLPFLSSYLQIYVDKLQEVNSLPLEKQKEIHKEIQSLRNTKLSLEQATEFLNVDRNKISEMHREKLPKVEEKLLKMKQGRIRSSQTNIPQSLQKRRKMKSKDEKNIMASSRNVVLPSLKQNPQVLQSDLFQQRQKLQQPEANQQLQMPTTSHQRNQSKDENNIMVSSENVMLPSLKQNPQVVQSDISLVQSDMLQKRQQFLTSEENQQLQKPTSHETNEMNDVSMRQETNIEADLLQQHLSSSHHQLPMPLASQAHLFDHEILPELVNETGIPTQSDATPISEWSIDRMIEVLVNEITTNSREDTIGDRIPGIFQSSEESRACLTEDITDTRRRSLITSQTDDGYKHLESEGDSTASSWPVNLCGDI